jgi:putative sterol carrier protein
LSQEWVDAFNAALVGVAQPGSGEDAGLAVADGPVTVAEEIHGGPDGTVRLLLHIDQGTLRLERSDRRPGASDQPTDEAGRAPDVTMVLSYQDAAAMSAGDLSPAEALNAGRIRVRGDLTVLVAAHQMLVAARGHTGDLATSTTY